MPPSVITELDGGVFCIALNRPQVHNALDEELIEGLRQAVDRAQAEREVTAVLLRGEGPSFCAGADVEWMKRMGSASEEENRRSAERLGRLFLALDRIEKPLLGRIHGNVFGGGVGLAAVCDLAVAATQSRFAVSEVRLGVVPAVIAPYLVRKVGPGRARDLVLTGRRFDGKEAEALGLVARAVDETLVDAALGRVLSDLRAGGPQAIVQAKRLLRDLDASALKGEELSDWTARVTAVARAGAEARAGLAAFLDKTPPPWAPDGGGRSP